MKIKGRVHKFGNHVDTDVIIPARYLNTQDPEELARHCMEDIDPNFTQRVQPGDLIVAGDNFGCGSSREHAPLSIKATGISCVIARSFARIFFRNSINIGLPIIQCPFTEKIKEGDIVEVDFSTGIIRDKSTGEEFRVEPFPPFIQELINAGGLLPWVKNKRK